MKFFNNAKFVLAVFLLGVLTASCGTPTSSTVEKSSQGLNIGARTVAQEAPIKAPAPTPVSTNAPQVEPTQTTEAKPKPAATSSSSSPTSRPTSKTSTPSMELAVTEVPSDLPGYDRGDWKHWVDEDADCQNTRHEVLVHESLVDVKFKEPNNCQVATGEWLDPFTGETITDATKLDVDHMVPLKNAHDSGGWAWDKDRKKAYANYMTYEDHLIAVTASANRKKGAKGPEDWKPSNEAYWCDYAKDWIEIKSQWNLTATNAEWTTLQEMTETCGQAIAITPVSPEVTKPIPGPTPKPIATMPSAPMSSGGSSEVQIASMDCKGKPEIIVLLNNGNSQQDMTQWTVTDEGTKHTFNFPNGFILEAGKSVEIVSGEVGDNTQSTLYWKKQAVWNNDGDIATVLDKDGNIKAQMDCS